VKKELEECAKDEELTGVSIRLVKEGDFTRLKGKIKGPVDTPYEGGIFKVDIEIPDKYPFEPPKMRFATKLWHPNVSSQTGAICLDGESGFALLLSFKLTFLFVQFSKMNGLLH